jgi:cyclopropane fatty-acyl-phospholipid synthase-like methyltransferase
MNEYFKIKEICRRGLIKYLEKACLKLPRLKSSNILDFGCGIGVPTIWFAENFSGNITAIDKDNESIKYLQHKVTEENLQNRINTLCVSFSEFRCESDLYDTIISEGFLNIVGFESGFVRIKEILKKSGYLVIHDEYKDHDKKLNLINNNKCKVIDTLYLDENVWWNDYYRQLEIEISKISISKMVELFKSDIEEINNYKNTPSLFRSIYYIIMKT